MKKLVFAVLVMSVASSVHAACEKLPKTWQRSDGPILRDPIAAERYEGASDAHVFKTRNGQLRMIYAGDDNGVISIKLATARNWTSWRPERVLLGPGTGHVKPISKETPFYRRAGNGEHQIYFIGYEDENEYASAIYLAVAKRLKGPYRVLPKPVMPLGRYAGHDVRVITSPSVVRHKGKLHMAFLGWDSFRNVSRVWSLGAVSQDRGRTWKQVREVDAPIGMEGQISPIPGGGFVAAATTEDDTGREAIFIACATHPFGPYERRAQPELTLAGPPWEKDEIIAPQVFFGTNVTRLIYTGADHGKGWWIMQAVGGKP